MLVKTAISFLLANSIALTGIGFIDASDMNVESRFSTYTSVSSRVSFKDDSTVLLYVDSSTGAYLAESAGSKIETRAAPIIGWIGALAVLLSAHAIRQMAARSISEALVKQAITQGVRSHANKGAWKYVTGRGKDKISVIVSKSTGKVITVTRG